MMTVTACSVCSASVRRLPGSSTTQTLCPACTDSGFDEMHQIVDAVAHSMLEQRLTRFDGSGAYDSAVLSPTPSTRWERLAVAAVADHRRAISERQPSRGGVIFIGPTGIGKTRAAIAMCRAVAEFDAGGVLVVSEAELFAPEIPPWELDAHIRRFVSGRRCVMVDDIGTVARPIDQVMAGWKAFVDALRAEPQPTLFVGTSNRLSWSDSPAGLAEWMGAQAVSRLREHCELATTGWTDYRTGRDHHQWQESLRGARR